MSAIEALHTIREIGESYYNLNPIAKKMFDIATAAIKEAEFTVEVKIPELNDGGCNCRCIFFTLRNPNATPLVRKYRCKLFNTDGDKPGPGCPQYKEEGNEELQRG